MNRPLAEMLWPRISAGRLSESSGRLLLCGRMLPARKPPPRSPATALCWDCRGPPGTPPAGWHTRKSAGAWQGQGSCGLLQFQPDGLFQRSFFPFYRRICGRNFLQCAFSHFDGDTLSRNNLSLFVSRVACPGAGRLAFRLTS